MTLLLGDRLIPRDVVQEIISFSPEKAALACLSKEWNILTTVLSEKDYLAAQALDPLSKEKVSCLSATPLTSPSSKLQTIFLNQFIEWMMLHVGDSEEMNWFWDSLFLPQWSLKYKRYLLYQLKTRENYPVEKATKEEIDIKLRKAHVKYQKERFLIIDIAFFKTMLEDCSLISTSICSFQFSKMFSLQSISETDQLFKNLIPVFQSMPAPQSFHMQKNIVEVIVAYRCSSTFEKFFDVLNESSVSLQQILQLLHLALIEANRNGCLDLVIRTYSRLLLAGCTHIQHVKGINPFRLTGNPAIFRFGISKGLLDVTDATYFFDDASVVGNTDAVGALLKLGAPLRKEHLINAACAGYVWIVDKIISDSKLKADQRFGAKQTALHILAEQIASPQEAARLEPVIQVFLQHGASLDLLDKQQQVPRQILLKSPHISQKLREQLIPQGTKRKAEDRSAPRKKRK